MRRLLRIVLCSVALLFALSSRLQVKADPQSSPDKTPHFLLTAFGKGDSPAVLQENELTVLTDKTPARVKTVRQAKDDPLLFAILVDISRSDAKVAEYVTRMALQLFQGLSGPRRDGYLVFINAQVAVSRAPLSISQAKNALDSAKFEGGSAIYDAIEQTCKQVLSKSANQEGSRRVIVLISDGEDNLSHVTRANAEQAALEEGVSVFSVVSDPGAGAIRGENILKEISQRTGGFSTDKDVKKAVRLLAAAIDAQAEITLAPTQASDGKLHSIETKCSRKDVKIYAPDAVLLE